MTELETLRVLATRVGEKSRVVTADLAGAGQTGDDDGAENFSDEEVLHPLGFASRPVVTEHTEAIALRVGDQQYVLFILDKGAAVYTDLEEGETRMSGSKEPSATIRIRADGSVEITPAAGTDLVLNGGTLKVARQTDSVNKSDLMGTWMTQVESALNGLAFGSVTPLSNTFTAIGEIASGASHIKG